MSFCRSQSDVPAVAGEHFPADDLIFGESQAMKALQAKIAIVAASKVPVLIRGERGTGKTLLARTIHRLSPAKDPGVFVTINFPVLSVSSFEGEIFGWKDTWNATPASGNEIGRVALSARGTLFLDEITDIDTASQARLLQLLQDGIFCPMGGAEETTVDVRVICSSSRDPEIAVANGSFRQDLYDRINVINLHLPPLRERRYDIPTLVEHFISSFNAKFNCCAQPLSQDLIEALQAYDWPGNVRQLENLIKRYVILGAEEVIASELNSNTSSKHVFANFPKIRAGESISLKHLTRDMVRTFEQEIIMKMLEAHRWNRAEAARALNISYRSLLYKVKNAQLGSPIDTGSD